MCAFLAWNALRPREGGFARHALGACSQAADTDVQRRTHALRLRTMHVSRALFCAAKAALVRAIDHARWDSYLATPWLRVGSLSTRVLSSLDGLSNEGQIAYLISTSGEEAGEGFGWLP